MKLWSLVGRIAFWVSWPALFVYLRIGKRTRVLLISGGKVLVLKTWLGPGKWVLPGGGLHSGEDATEGALRELKEETGVVLAKSDLTHVGSARYKAYGISFDCERFIAKLDTQVSIQRQKSEIIQSAWIDPKELSSQNSIADVIDLLEVCESKPNLIK